MPGENTRKKRESGKIRSFSERKRTGKKKSWICLCPFGALDKSVIAQKMACHFLSDLRFFFSRKRKKYRNRRKQRFSPGIDLGSPLFKPPATRISLLSPQNCMQFWGDRMDSRGRAFGELGRAGIGGPLLSFT